MSFTKGQQVVQITTPPIVGKVAGFSVDQETGEVQVLVAWTASDGTAHQRYFKQTELVGEPTS